MFIRRNDNLSIDDKTVAIVAANEFEDIELEFPLLRLSEEGVNVILVPVKAGHHPRPSLEQTGTKPVTGRYGTPIPPDVIRTSYEDVQELEDLDLDEIDCVLLPGGFSPDHLRTVKRVVEFTKEAYEKGKLIATICHGPQVLIEANLVKGKKVTGYKAVKTDLINAGAEFRDVPAIKDGRIITGRVPDDLPEFCQTIIEALEER